MTATVFLLSWLLDAHRAVAWQVPFFSRKEAESNKQPPPPPRFIDNQDGTVTDAQTDLFWLKDANCVIFFIGNSMTMNSRSWKNAVDSAGQLASGFCGLKDGSKAGDWRLPSKDELIGLVTRDYETPALSNAAGTGQWTDGDPFVGVQSFFYWSSTEDKTQIDYAFYMNMAYGVESYAFQMNAFHVWPVRDKK